MPGASVDSDTGIEAWAERLGEDQAKVVDSFGLPDIFYVSYASVDPEAAEPGSEGRYEWWEYSAVETRFYFVDGVFVASADVPFDGERRPTHAAYVAPTQFERGMRVEEVADAVGHDPSDAYVGTAGFNEAMELYVYGELIDVYFDADGGLLGVRTWYGDVERTLDGDGDE